MRRLAALVIALIAWSGLGLQLLATMELYSLPGAAWILLRYFTIIANLLVAIVMTAAATGNNSVANARNLGGVTASIVLVGVVYALLLSGMLELSGGARLADLINHRITPVLVPLYWLAFAPRGDLKPTDPLLWALLPALYFPYAMIRGYLEGAFAYPFLDVNRIGWAGVLAYAIAMAAGVLAVGAIMVLIDKALAKPSGKL